MTEKGSATIPDNGVVSSESSSPSNGFARKLKTQISEVWKPIHSIIPLVKQDRKLTGL